MRPGESFEDAEVAGLYVHRPEYPHRVFEHLAGLAPGRVSLLDLGCGTGKIARGLAPAFDRVTALDASRAMLRVAGTLPGGGAGNITWVHGLAETAPLGGATFELMVAAESIHWMDQPRVFPRLAAATAPDHVFAVVDGDGADRPPWQPDWDEFLGRWIFELKGERYEPDRPDSAYQARMNRYRNWIDVAGEAEFVSEPVSQTVADFVCAQHSRDTFAPAKLGARRQRFAAELTELLAPHAEDGRISYSVRTTVTWGAIDVES